MSNHYKTYNNMKDIMLENIFVLLINNMHKKYFKILIPNKHT